MMAHPQVPNANRYPFHQRDTAGALSAGGSNLQQPTRQNLMVQDQDDRTAGRNQAFTVYASNPLVAHPHGYPWPYAQWPGVDAGRARGAPSSHVNARAGGGKRACSNGAGSDTRKRALRKAQYAKDKLDGTAQKSVKDNKLRRRKEDATFILKRIGYPNDSEAIMPIIVKAMDAFVGVLGSKKKKDLVLKCIEQHDGPELAKALRDGTPLVTAKHSGTTCAAFAVTNDDAAAAQPEFESEHDPHAGLISPRGVDVDVTTIGASNSNFEDSKMPAVQEVTSSMSVSKVPDDENNEDDNDNEMLDEADDADDIIALPPPPSFDEDHLQVIGEGIYQTKVAQVEVGNVGKTNSSGSLLYLPPKSWSPDHDMHPLKDAKIVLRTRFKGIPNEAVGGTKRIRSLGPVHRSSDLYHTLILSTQNDTGTSVVLWKSVEEGRSWFISWFAVNAKCEGWCGWGRG